jgi:hypothetical protein
MRRAMLTVGPCCLGSAERIVHSVASPDCDGYEEAESSNANDVSRRGQRYGNRRIPLSPSRRIASHRMAAHQLSPVMIYHQRLSLLGPYHNLVVLASRPNTPSPYRNTKQTRASSDTSDSVATSGRSGTDSPRTPTTSTFQTHRTSSCLRRA